MHVLELVVALLIGGALLSVLAERLAVPAPALLALAGAAVALLPGTPEVQLDPGLALALFVAPILVKAARETSLRDLRDHWAPVVALVVILVCLTAVAVALTARWLLPDLPWAAALALGAVVAPPDASAATPVLRRLSPPHRAQVILEGESLLNDATALLLFRLALVASAGQMVDARAIALTMATTWPGWSSAPRWVGCSCGSGPVPAPATPAPSSCSSSSRRLRSGCWPSAWRCRRSSPWWRSPCSSAATRRAACRLASGSSPAASGTSRCTSSPCWPSSSPDCS